MAISEKPLAERIARVLAGAALSSNAEGSDPSAADKVDLAWPEHLNQAIAVLHTMREADERMADLGDAETWTKMVETAIEEAGAGV
jgi:hypothetical protein